MICTSCRDAAEGKPDAAHTNCVDRGRIAGPGRWCDCQHDPRPATPAALQRLTEATPSG